VERDLEMIGEATNIILKKFPDINIPNSRRIVDLRNLIIHGYDSVDNIIIWAILENDLPELKNQVSLFLNITD
jgi:uncharacterized protein with HEPN domain